MDEIEKALKKLTSKEKSEVEKILRRLKDGNFIGLDVKKLKGREDVFRVRKGNVRIIYRVADSKEIYILAIERRAEKTYKFN
ncbi:MAG: type II toxin-antitoxin system RelE/ParE family toxin [Candidatus Wolfebacteria bacterium]|nr:type II toxin-antitoxin system RelE/ParE family toxin [Candidatus Wolfebacteria bacterium]